MKIRVYAIGKIKEQYLKDGIVCVGVGAAFRATIGGIKAPDGILQKMGLAGLVFRRPGVSLWNRIYWYVCQSRYLVKYFIQIHFRRLIGKKYYEL